MKKILSILAFVLVAIAVNAQVYSNVPAGPIMPVATPFSAYWVNTATDAASGLSLLGGGAGGTTNFLLSGFVTGQTTNNSFSTSGSNVIANIAQQYAGGSNSINNLNGFGTNTTLKSAISISTTNLSAKGTTWLNNSNVVVYLYGYAGNSNGVIPYMTSSNTPSGLATANTNAAGRDAYLAFQPINQGGASSWGVSSTFGITSNWLQYKFDAPVTVYSNVFGLNFNGGSFFLQSSMDGLSWNLITNQILPAFPSGNGVTNSFSPVTATYFRWLFTNMTAPPNIAINDNKLFGTSSQGNVFSNSYTLSILATNGGVAINTNSAGTNALEVFGNVDSTVGFTINGQPIGGAASSPIGTYSQLYVTNATGSATNYNGIYTSAGTYYTNNSTGWFIVAPATWYPSATNIPRSSYTSYGLITNLVGGTTIPAFSNATLIGTYSGNPTNIFPTVTPYYGQTSGTTYTNFSGTIGAGGILGNGIDTNLSPAQLASAGVVTATNTTVYSTNNGFYFSGWSSNYLNGNWYLQITNQGNAAGAFAIYTNSANTNSYLVLNSSYDTGNWDIFYVVSGSTNLIFDNAGSGSPLTGWENSVGGGAPGTVVASNFVFASTQSILNTSTNQFYSTSPLAPQFNTASAVFLDTNATLPGIRGNPQRPFNLVHQAVAASRPGDAFVFAAGQRFPMWFDFIPTNCVLVGNGATLVASDTNQTFFGTLCYAGFFPRYTCKMYSLNFYMPNYNGSSFLATPDVTNFYALGCNLQSGSFFSYQGAGYEYLAGTTIEYNSCQIDCGDLNQLSCFGVNGASNSITLVLKNNNFFPHDFNDQYRIEHGVAVWPQVVSLKNCTAFIDGNTFDFRNCWTNNSGANFTNACAVLADSNSIAYLGNNIFQTTTLSNNFAAPAVLVRNNGLLYGKTNDVKNAYNGSALTNLNASALAGGTVSTNIPITETRGTNAVLVSDASGVRYWLVPTGLLTNSVFGMSNGVPTYFSTAPITSIAGGTNGDYGGVGITNGIIRANDTIYLGPYFSFQGGINYTLVNGSLLAGNSSVDIGNGTSQYNFRKAYFNQFLSASSGFFCPSNSWTVTFNLFTNNYWNQVGAIGQISSNGAALFWIHTDATNTYTIKPAVSFP